MLLYARAEYSKHNYANLIANCFTYLSSINSRVNDQGIYGIICTVRRVV